MDPGRLGRARHVHDGIKNNFIINRLAALFIQEANDGEEPLNGAAGNYDIFE